MTAIDLPVPDSSFAFFYGVLMHPAILARVLGHDGSKLNVCPAILPAHTRHCVKGADYPAVIPYESGTALFERELSREEQSVRGVLVGGLSAADWGHLDIFEGDEYTRETVSAHPLGELQPLPTAKDLITHSSPLSEILSTPVKSSVYIWCSKLERLEPQIWSYDTFVTEKLSKWVGDDEEYHEVDRRRQMNGTIVQTPVPNVAKVEFGHALLSEFAFGATYVNLNHGSYGSTPRRVLRAVEDWQMECEARPDKFMRRTYQPILESVRARVAGLIGAETDECVIVPNASHGIGVVLRNIIWQPGDVLIGFSTTYGAISRALQYLSDVAPHPTLTVIDLIFPMSHKDILDRFRAHVKSIPRTPSQQVVAVIDGIISNPGVVLPWEEMTKICKEENVWSVIDAAHCIGQVPVNLAKSQPDFWVSNCHKWLSSKRGSAVLYVPKRNQHVIRSSFPTSHMYLPIGMSGAPNFVAQHEWNGTRDFSSFLSIGPALDFRASLGGEEAINKYCHALALEGGKRLAEVLGTRSMDETGELTAHMNNVLLPENTFVVSTSTAENVQTLNDITDKLLARDCFIAIYLHDNKWWVRGSAQVWNDISDFEFVGKMLLEVGEELATERLARRASADHPSADIALTLKMK